MDRVYLEGIRRRMQFDPEIPEGADVDVLAATPVLWSGWECDTVAVLYRIRPEEKLRLHVMDGVHVTPENLQETLQERVVAYKEAIEETEEFLKLLGHPAGCQDS